MTNILISAAAAFALIAGGAVVAGNVDATDASIARAAMQAETDALWASKTANAELMLAPVAVAVEQSATEQPGGDVAIILDATSQLNSGADMTKDQSAAAGAAGCRLLATANAQGLTANQAEIENLAAILGQTAQVLRAGIVPTQYQCGVVS